MLAFLLLNSSVLAAPREVAIQQLMERIEPRYRPHCAMILRGEAAMFSQAWQDWYLFHNLFSDRLTWGNGTYLDIGSNDPTFISNTLFFDKCLGWHGVCFEMQEAYREVTRRHRSCTLVPRCVFGHAINATFVGRGSGAVLHETVDIRTSETTPTVSCVVAGEQVRQSLTIPPTHPGHIDLISIDIESAENLVLRCFPLEQLRVHAVLIETNKHDLSAVDLWFHRRGYSNRETFLSGSKRQGPHAASNLDHLYVRNSIPTVYPPALAGHPNVNELKIHCTPHHISGANDKKRDAYAAAGGANWCEPWHHWKRGTGFERVAVAQPGGWNHCESNFLGVPNAFQVESAFGGGVFAHGPATSNVHLTTLDGRRDSGIR